MTRRLYCAYCGEMEKPEAENWQQWQCACCGSWTDKDVKVRFANIENRASPPVTPPTG